MRLEEMLAQALNFLPLDLGKGLYVADVNELEFA